MREPSSIIMLDVQQEEAKQAVRASQAERVNRILERDYDQFKRIREFVLEHMGYLRGKPVPIEVDSIQHLGSLNCMVINDLVLVSYIEAMDMILELMDKDKKENGRRTTSDDSGKDSDSERTEEHLGAYQRGAVLRKQFRLCQGGD